jgi:hypothetical protein
MFDEIPMMWFILFWGYIIVHLRVDGPGNPYLILFGVLYGLACSIIHYQGKSFWLFVSHVLGAYVTAFQVHFAVLAIWTLQSLLRLSFEKPPPSKTSKFPMIALIMILASFSFWVRSLLCSSFHFSEFSRLGG